MINRLPFQSPLERDESVSGMNDELPEKTSKTQDLIRKGHFPSADLRGFKADTWECPC